MVGEMDPRVEAAVERILEHTQMEGLPRVPFEDIKFIALEDYFTGPGAVKVVLAELCILCGIDKVPMLECFELHIGTVEDLVQFLTEHLPAEDAEVPDYASAN